jgi:hypothetical protein
VPRCQALTGAIWRHQQNWIKRCENTAAHLVDGVGLCGTHFNAGFRGPLEIVGELRKLDEPDMTGST